jgi:pyruvate formate lyase activating enzyme
LLTGVIFDLKKYAVHDGPGIRTTVFLKGCPLNCAWCHNPESMIAEPETLKVKRRVIGGSIRENEEVIGRRISISDLIKEIEKDLLFYDESKGGITFSGGEPFMQTEFLLEALRETKLRDINTAIDTSGYTNYSNFQKVIPFTDLFLFDLKVMDDEVHQKYTSVSNKLILENLEKLSESDVRLRVRIPLIPKITDTEKNINDVLSFLSTLKKNLPVDLLPYNEICEGKYERFNRNFELKKAATQSDSQLESIKEQFTKNGFEVKLRG